MVDGSSDHGTVGASSVLKNGGGCDSGNPGVVVVGADDVINSPLPPSPRRRRRLLQAPCWRILGIPLFKLLLLLLLLLTTLAQQQLQQQQQQQPEKEGEVHHQQQTTTISSLGQADFAFPNDTLTRIAFGSCHKNKYVWSNPNLWKHIATAPTLEATAATTAEQNQYPYPQAWLWLGDAVYPPVRGIASTELLQAEYERFLSIPNYYHAVFQPPLGIFGTWDDHDYGGNDIGADMPDKRQRAALYWNFLQRSSTTTTRQYEEFLLRQEQQERDGLYSSITWGTPPHQVKAILLDTRWHRHEYCIPSVAATELPLGAALACFTRLIAAGFFPRTCRDDPSDYSLLGKEQWEWLTAQLRESQASVHIIGSSIQAFTTNPVMESWGHFPAERERLLRLLNGVPGVLVLSGDVHHGEMIDPSASTVQSQHGTSTTTTTNESLLEITSSGMTHVCTKGLLGHLCKPILDFYSKHRFQLPDNGVGGEQRRPAYYLDRNFGTIDIDWQVDAADSSASSPSSAKFRVNLHSAWTGEVVLSTGYRSVLQKRWTEEEIQSVAQPMDGHLILPVSIFLILLLIVVILWSRRRRETNRAMNAEAVAKKAH